MTRELLLPLLLAHNSIFHKKYVFFRFGLFLTHPIPHPVGVQLQMLSKKRPLLAELCASITQKRSLSQTEVISSTSSAAPLEEGRPSKRKAKDESTNLQNTKTPKVGGELPVPKRLKGKPQNPFLCAVPSCEIVVTAEVTGFSRKTALVDHYKMHLKKGVVPEISSSTLVSFCRCAAIKLTAQACRECGQVENLRSLPGRPRL